MKAIIYTSNTGFTARYASMLAEATGLPVYELETARKQLPKGTPVIYMGWLFASMVKGYATAAKRWDIKAVVGVGMCETGTLLEDVRKVNRLGELPLFTVQGGMDHGKLKGINRFMIQTLIKVMSKQKNPSADDQKKLALIQEGGDYVSRENLSEFLQWFGEQKA